jgi:hypothetical protein
VFWSCVWRHSLDSIRDWFHAPVPCKDQQISGGKNCSLQGPDRHNSKRGLEKEHGKWIWSFDVSTPSTKDITEVQVDARNGRIVSVQIETPAAQFNRLAVVYFASKPLDIDINQITLRIKMIFPNMLAKLRTGQHAARSSH